MLQRDLHRIFTVGDFALDEETQVIASWISIGFVFVSILHLFLKILLVSIVLIGFFLLMLIALLVFVVFVVVDFISFSLLWYSIKCSGLFYFLCGFFLSSYCRYVCNHCYYCSALFFFLPSSCYRSDRFPSGYGMYMQLLVLAKSATGRSFLCLHVPYVGDFSYLVWFETAT